MKNGECSHCGSHDVYTGSAGKPKGGETDRPSRIATIEGLNGANPSREGKWER